AAADPRVWLLTLLYFAIAAGANGFGFYMPTLIDTHFPGLNKFQVGLLAAVPSACAVVGMIVNGWHSDRTGERPWHGAAPALLSAVGCVGSAWLEAPVAVLFALALAQAGVMSTIAPFWSLPTAFLSGAAAAGGIAVINAVGNLGGFVAPYLMGELK